MDTEPDVIASSSAGTHTCPYCDKEYKKWGTMAKHVSKIHNVILKSPPKQVNGIFCTLLTFRAVVVGILDAFIKEKSNLNDRNVFRLFYS